MLLLTSNLCILTLEYNSYKINDGYFANSNSLHFILFMCILFLRSIYDLDKAQSSSEYRVKIFPRLILEWKSIHIEHSEYNLNFMSYFLLHTFRSLFT